MTYRLAQLSAVLLGLVSACSFDAAPTERLENRCASDVECTGRAVCDIDLEMCVTPSTAPLKIALEVTPSADTAGGPATTHLVGPLEVLEPSQQDLVLPAAIDVFGTVRVPGEETAVTADMTFTRKDTFEPAPPRPQVTSSTLGTPIVAADEMEADYSVKVLAEREYDVLVQPTGEAASRLPPLRRTVAVPGGGDLVRFNVEYPAEMPVVEGIVVALGADMETEEPRGGLQIRAVDPATGTVVSSTGTTAVDGEIGTFSITLLPTAGDYVLRISGGSDRPLFPTLLADPAYFFPDGEGAIRILVPDLAPVCYQGRAEGPAGGLAGANISFRSVDVFDDTTGVVGSFATIGRTDASGVFRADILPGTYEVVVTPPSGTAGDLGVAVETMLRIEEPAPGAPCISGQLFELPERAVQGGVVNAPDGEPVAGATVLAAALGRRGEVPAARFNRSSDTTTDPTGQFRLPVDFGSYDIIVKPPSESGYPWLIRPNATFASSTTVRDTFELTAPLPLRGTVLSAGEDGAPLAGAEIRAWGLVTEEDGATRAVQIGRATADEDGSYTLLLPARL